MTEPAPPRPVDGPARPVPGPGPRPHPSEPAVPTTADQGSRFAGLAERPVAEHVAVYEAEHRRLQGELSTIDQL